MSKDVLFSVEGGSLRENTTMRGCSSCGNQSWNCVCLDDSVILSLVNDNESDPECSILELGFDNRTTSFKDEDF